MSAATRVCFAIATTSSLGFVSALISSLLMLNLVSGLRLTNMSTPLVADTRHAMELDCRFDMEAEELYAVKWYKDDQEFFRYMPHQQPHIMSFPVAGVHLVPLGTNCGWERCTVQLTGLTRHHSGGAYRCEVSSEAPTFRLAAETHNVTVATLPLNSPSIEGVQDLYNEGDMLLANCTSPPSDPAPILTWQINKQQAPATFHGNTKPSDTDELAPHTISLRFQVTKKHSQGETDAMELRCVSSLPGIPLPPQATSREVTINSRRPQAVSNEKLHWFNSSSYPALPHRFLIIMLLAAGRW